MVAVITIIVVLNYMDRGAINLIVNPIKDDLHLTDVEMGSLLGLSFVTLYSLSSLPAGYLADRVNRKLMIFGAILFWSCMLVVSGLANSYWQLFGGRVGLGVGEACMPPAAYSLIRDGVPRDKHARAFAIYGLGGSWGLGLGALAAGALFAAGTRGGFAGWPILDSLKPWQLVLAVPGLGGILVAFLILTVREPPRPEKTLAAAPPTFGEAFRYLGRNWRLYAPMIAAVTLYLMAGGGLVAWLPAAVNRKWGVSTAETAHMIGLLQIFLLPVNNWTIGYLMDRFGRKGARPDMYLLVPMIPIGLTIAPVSLYFLVPTVGLTWVMVGCYTLLNCSTLTMAGTLLAAITPGRLMGKMTALYFLIANILGFAVGPSLYALVAEHVFSGPLAIVGAIQVCFPIATLISVVLLAYGARQLRLWRPAAEMVDQARR
jgi:MFS family permease